MKEKNSYYQNPRQEMLKYIPQKREKALEIGCAAGAFGKLLKQEGAHEVWGIELESEAGEQAKKVLDKVLIGDVNLLINDVPKDYFDIIILNDVLEHIADPEDLLKKLNLCLNETGYVVSSIPNVRYFWNLYEILIKKEWEYKDQGILDKTHLRFFTKKSIERMFKRLPYRLKLLEGIQPLKKWKFLLINILTLFTQRDTQFLQFVAVAQKR